jgi:hypothetical protein
MQAFDKPANDAIETAHNAGQLKCRVKPLNANLKTTPMVPTPIMATLHHPPALSSRLGLKVLGDMLILAQKRHMINLVNGKTWELRRQQPHVVYSTLEVGAFGPGDRAQEEVCWNACTSCSWLSHPGPVNRLYQTSRKETIPCTMQQTQSTSPR